MSDAFRTFQTVRRYEEALARHGQFVRWTQAIKCACVNQDTMQPEPRCSVCKGRGRVYRTPERFQLLNEVVKHDGQGRVYTKYSPIIANSATVYHKNLTVTLSVTQPADGSYIQMEPPYLEPYRVLTASYSFSPEISVTAENSTVYDSTRYILRVIAARFDEKGKSFEGSIQSVSRVYNATRTESYTVSSFTKEYITLSGMGTWQSGDTLEVDYIYVKPFDFMLSGVTGRMRYEQPYILPDADATLVTPYWAQVAPDDMLTALAQEQIGSTIIQPTLTAGNDEINSVHDLSRLLRVIDKNGTDYTVGPGQNVEIFGRNELKWNTTKPAIAYTVQFTYHPTYSALIGLHTLRNSENKAFVNRLSVKLADRLHEKDTF